MALVTFETLSKNYPYPDKLDHDALFDELGWSEDLKENSEYANTCAIRMSYCLALSGIPVKGGFNILKGPHKGKRLIETSQKKLTKYMKEHLRAYIGQPKPLKKSEKNGFLINKRHGIMSFMEIEGYDDTSGNLSGHIDLIWTKKETTSIFGIELETTFEEACGSGCYWDVAKELLFWELK